MEQTTQKKETKFNFPTEEVTLPSKGLLYPEDSPLSKGVIEMKYMTAREEDILTNQNYIKAGTVIDKLLQSLIVTDIDYNDLLIGDKNAILIASRILGYGAEYTFKMLNPTNGEEENVTVDLTEADDKWIDESLIQNNTNDFEFELPTSKINVNFKLLTHKDDLAIDREIKGLKKINKNSSSDMSTRMKHIITAVDGDREKKTIREFVDTALLAKDSRALRNYMTGIMPDIDLEFDIEFDNGHVKEGVTLPIGVGFFWPDVEL